MITLPLITGETLEEVALAADEIGNRCANNANKSDGVDAIIYGHLSDAFREFADVLRERMLEENK